MYTRHLLLQLTTSQCICATEIIVIISLPLWSMQNKLNAEDSNVGRYGKFNIGIWYDSNITVYRYMHAATSRLPGRSLASFAWSSLPLGLLFAFFTSKCRWGRWTFRCESRFDVLPPFADTDFLHNRQITASWTFGLPSSSASNPKYIHTDDFAPLDFETRPSLSLVPLSLLDV